MGRQHPAATRPATSQPAESARSSYWFADPPVAAVSCSNYDALWEAARRVALDEFFTIDRRDYRGGVLTTKPLVSKQFFEFWRSDVVDGHSLAQSSLATMRRLVRFEIARREDGSYVLSPKVVVERYSTAERRITSVTEYLDVFNYRRQAVDRQTDEGTPVPVEYWYAVGRDHALEQRLARAVRNALPKNVCD